MLQRQRAVALGAFGHILDVGFGTRPPDTQHPVTRVSRGLGFAQRGRVHHPPAPEQDVVRFLLPDLQPGGFLLDAGVSHRQQLHLETIGLAQLLQHRDGFLAIRTVVVDEGNLLALQLGDAAFLLGDVLDGDLGANPVSPEQRKVPGEDGTVL